MRQRGINYNSVQTHTSGFSLNSGQVLNLGSQTASDVDNIKR